MCTPRDACSSSLSAIHLLHMLCCHSRWGLALVCLQASSSTMHSVLSSVKPLISGPVPPPMCGNDYDYLIFMASNILTFMTVCMLALAPAPAESHTPCYHAGPKATQHKLADAEQCMVSYQCHVLPAAECNMTVQTACASSNQQCLMCTPACNLVLRLS